MDITLPAWPFLMGPFLKASGRVLERDAIFLVVQGSAALGFININVLLGRELCSWQARLPPLEAKATFLLERGSVCIITTGIAKHLGGFNVLFEGSYARTHPVHCC